MEDLLEYLPCSTIAEYEKDQIIYSQNRPPTGIYLIINGRVQVSLRSVNRDETVIVDIYRADELFGESALLNSPNRREQAIAMEKTQLMTWTALEIESLILRRPRLGLALLQFLAQRIMEFGYRIESFSSDDIESRLARSLMRFGERLGVRDDDGSVRLLGSYTHALLSEYVGTTREAITHHMSQFRRQGHVRYSRKGVILSPNAFKKRLRQVTLTAE